MTQEMPILQEGTVSIPAGPFFMSAQLDIPGSARGIVILVESFSVSHHLDSLGLVRDALFKQGLATLTLGNLPDPEYPPSDSDERSLYDLHRRVRQVVDATDWLAGYDVGQLPLGYLGIDAGAVAALHAAAARPMRVAALVAIDGHTHLARRDLLKHVHAPTLIIAGKDGLGPDQADLHGECRRHHMHAVEHPLESRPSIGESCVHACAWFHKYFELARATKGEARVQA